MGTRPRIQPLQLTVAEVDTLVFTKNKCSPNARFISSSVENLEISIWIDKHYHIREQLGDDDGKRIGIEKNAVELLIKEAAKHLLYYSLKIRTFSFVNFEQNGRCERVVLTQNYDEEPSLNIIVEYHYVSINKYEVTVITALKKDEFYFSDGQFQIQIESDGCSTLHKNERKVIKTISEFQPY